MTAFATSSLPAVPAPPNLPLATLRAQLLAAPDALHPALWRARGGVAGGGLAAVQPSGFARLDAELPGGGWPQRVLTELLLPQPGVGEVRLLAPALAQLLRAGRSLMLFEPPAQVSAEALVQLGLPPAQCIVVRGRGGVRAPGLHPRQGAADLCWALEQALRSGQVGAVLAWLGPAAKPDVLRRLQLAAQAHEGPAFLLRELSARQQPSPAPLRLMLGCSGPDELSLHIIKRRGPAQAQPLCLALAPVLSARAMAKAVARSQPQVPAGAAAPGPAPDEGGQQAPVLIEPGPGSGPRPSPGRAGSAGLPLVR